MAKDKKELSFGEKEKLRQMRREERVVTRSFRQKQTFGPASEVRRIPVEEYLKEKDNNG
jgi:hypothetical protein